MAEFSDTSSTSTLSPSADSSAADTSTDSSVGAAATGGSGWGDIFRSDTAGRDTPSESADVAKEGAIDTEATTEAGAEAGKTADADQDARWDKDPRWQAWKAEKALLEQVKPLIEPLLQQYGGIDGINAELAKQAQEAERAQAAEIERQDQAAIEQRLQHQLQAGELPEEAYDHALKHEVAVARIYRIEMGNAVQTAAASFPDMDRDLVQAFAQDPEMVSVIARHTHERVAGIKTEHAREIEALKAQIETSKQQAITEYVAANKERFKQPPAEGGGGSGPGGPIDRNHLPGWGSILGGRGRKA